MPTILENVKNKITAGVLEPSQAAYRSSIFFVKKKDGKLQQVIDLRTLNSYAIRDAGLPPVIDAFIEPFAMFHLFKLRSAFGI